MSRGTSMPSESPSMIVGFDIGRTCVRFERRKERRS